MDDLDALQHIELSETETMRQPTKRELACHTCCSAHHLRMRALVRHYFPRPCTNKTNPSSVSYADSNRRSICRSRTARVRPPPEHGCPLTCTSKSPAPPHQSPRHCLQLSFIVISPDLARSSHSPRHLASSRAQVRLALA